MSKGFEVEAGRIERTAPYLKQSQIEDMGQEEKRLSETLNAPPHLRNAIQDRGQLMSTLKKLRTSLERDAPRKLEGSALDAAVKRERELREAFVADMCTQTEMRRNPPGAVDKHLMFEAKHKENIGEWKNLRRRLYVSGALPSNVSERSLANIEMFRPAGGSGEMPMDGAQIPQKTIFHGLGGRSSPFNEKQLALIELLAPDIYAQLALLSADQRDDLKAAVEAHGATPAIDPATVDWVAMPFKEVRERCRVLDLETGGSRDDLIARLKEHYAAQDKAA